MRQSVRRKAGVILIQRRIMTSRTKHRGWMVHHHGPRARLSPDFSLDLTRRLGTPKHCAGWGERVLARDLQLTLWQPHLPRDAGGKLWYPAGLTLSSHPLLLEQPCLLHLWLIGSSPAHPCTLNTTGSRSGWGRRVLSQNSFQAGKPGVHTHRPQGTHCTAIIRPIPLSQGVIPAGRGWGMIRQKGLDIGHGQFSESAPQYPVSRLHHRVWSQGAAALPSWPWPLRMGGWHEGTGEHGNVRLWRERTGR